jgi:hypothetical protein
MEKNKVILLIVCLTAIIVLSTLCFIYKDKLFTNRTVITYEDGCEEIYLNGILSGGICEYGRELEQKRLDEKSGVCFLGETCA